jgi:hypothetical protein
MFAGVSGLLSIPYVTILGEEAAPVKEQVIAVAGNRDPKILPTLSFSEIVWDRSGKKHPTVVSRFPNVPELNCDIWCYESGWLEFLDARAIDKGRLEFNYRVREHPRVIVVTTVTPEAGAVEFVAHIEVADSAGGLPADLRSPNIC